jgi:hypothetical protein
MRCPNGYKQHPPKSGNCVPKTAKKIPVKKDAQFDINNQKQIPSFDINNNQIQMSKSPLHNSPINVKKFYERLRNDVSYRSVNDRLDEVLIDDIEENELNYAKKNFKNSKMKT